MVSEPSTRYGCAPVVSSDVVDWAAIGSDPARNRPDRQARENFASLLPELMPYSANPMTNEAPSGARPLFVTVGDNPARPFGMGVAERAEALAVKAKLEPADEARTGRSTIYADLNWGWDPEWLVALRDK